MLLFDDGKKADIQLVRSEMKEMEARLTALLHKDRVDSIKWIAGMLIAQAAAVAALVRLL